MSMTKAQKIMKCISMVEDMLDIINPDKRWWLAYGGANDLPFRLTEWEMQYHSIREGNEEYIFVFEMRDDGERDTLLYTINVSGDSAICAMSELFNLLGRKF